MKIADTELVNRYIATQGPLQTTTEDFWQMVLEEECTHIVMLTTVVERGRAKCHKYWPGLNETFAFQYMTIKCICEETDDSGSFVFRDIVLSDIKVVLLILYTIHFTEFFQNDIHRDIKHMQYVAWPDHGVPDSPGLFLAFTEHVRESRSNSSGPIIVHCSAGIGRTGVLVLMETALCLIEANEPVYPLDIVQTMREQRAMMIQNAVSWFLI